MGYKVLCLVAVALIVGTISSANGQFTKEQCAVKAAARINCGYSGITPQQCVEKKCCFDSSVPDAPWCYQAQAVVKPDEHKTNNNENNHETNNKNNDECLW
ncbi:hypothetical protein GDO86_020097 [Hymenochirus boettgeri]|uniref:P-type domain-containing protein n=1 Tax=Hymenochirus boettgeri TaxID=247094 RepID=A0A8T2IKN2_9PIPI|nr:hypothetical protein GDO86_020097 [Hymenochirus boettgeri]